MTIEQISVDSIRLDGGTQARHQDDWVAIDEYARAMQEEAQFPPIVVFQNGEPEYWLADGFHRVRAALKAGRTEIAADVREGGKRDAILYAVGANSEHGVRRTNADKRRAVTLLLEDAEWVQWSDGEIARKCGVNQSTVSRIRAELTNAMHKSQPVIRKGADGRTINTSNIGKRSEPEPEPPQMPMPEPRNEWENGAVGLERDWSEQELDEYAEANAVTVDVEPYQFVQPPIPERKFKPAPDLPTAVAARPTAIEPEPTPDPQITLHNADSRQMWHFDIAPVHLVVTSPPYNVGLDYEMHQDDLTTYTELITDIWRECYRTMVDGGRIAVVVPFGVGRNPWVPMAAKVCDTLTAAGFTLRGQIIWDKGTSGNRTTWGSFRLPTNPSLRDTSEAIIVAHKGSAQLEIPAECRLKDDKGTHTAWLESSDYFMELAQDHWAVSPESARRVKHPAPFPVELVRRLIHFYAFPGAHVLDPFGGSGTVGVAAKALACAATLFEIDASYCEIATERIRDGI